MDMISDQKAIERAEKVASIKRADNFSDFDIYIICVSTHKPDDIFSPQIDGLLFIIEENFKEKPRMVLLSQ